MGWLHLRQICLVARRLEPVLRDFVELLDMPVVHGSGDLSPHGLPAKGPMFEGGHQVLEALGVENLIFGAGTDFVEVLFPTRAEGSTVRLMDRRGGDTGYMIILQGDDVELYQRRAEHEGIRVVHQANYPHYRDLHFHPKDTGGALLSVARNLPDNSPNGAWYPAGTAWTSLRKSKFVRGIAAAELQSPDPEKLATRWARVLGREVERRGEQITIRLDAGVLRFVPEIDGRGEGFSGFDLYVSDPEAIRSAAVRRGLLRPDSSLQIGGMRVALWT